jgi:hypothetical protein
LNITLLSVNITTIPTTKGIYQAADVAFKNNTYGGKVEGKKVMSFGITQNTFTALSTAQPGESYDVTVVKNDKGFNDWTSIAKAGAVAPAVAASTPGKPASATPARSSYETPEERAQRQVFIVRQSSLNCAVATLAVGSKGLKHDDVIATAKFYEKYVFSTGVDDNATGFDDLPAFGPEFEVPQVN